MLEVHRLMAKNVGKPAQRAAMVFIHHGQPVPKPRPRVTANGTFTPAKGRAAEELLHRAFRLHWDRHREEGLLPERDGLLSGPLALFCVFYLQDRRRVDKDNLEKLVKDAANGQPRRGRPGIWEDDYQVTGGATLKRLCPSGVEPQTQIALTFDADGDALFGGRRK